MFLDLSNNTFLLKELADSKPSINENTKQEIDKKYKNYETALKYNSWKELVFDNIKMNK